ncbi:FAD-binding oxidoreductase [Aurantiacibacter aquimixticola]|uniref:D-lactate dehydrogenase (cytochrome) n=1 Tax=Aurantiacibacter aquimixticola TaxID=1958945 RepID=A0A419RW79_9SPHN|nr:FAD-binding oxidoreductase [Aurantiacibacter aquimixticola]RJY10038.1 FAD-binding oxidoreductase [Aurantiacibacter aquimixticola]
MMATLAETSLTDSLAASGADVLTDEATLDYFAHDIFSRGADLSAVVRPSNKEQLAAAIRAATNAGHAVAPRGGGMSYTGGYTQTAPGTVLFDLAAMDRILEVNEEDMWVRVEAGCTWAALHEKLAPLGLRTPMWGTLSGLKATVGGGMSQNGIFWGTARHGTAVQSCLSLEVALADGTLMQVGKNFMRPYGPDLTGLFLADTGALSMKAEITLRLVREAQANAYASFAFDDRQGLLAASSEIERAGIATECFGFDPHLNAIRMKRDSLASDARQLVGMMKKQGGLLKGLKEGAKVALAGRDFLKDANYSLHVLAEGRNQASADADIAAARQIVAERGGREVENTIPKIIRANPFGPLNSILGPDGERWGPIHCLLPHGGAEAFCAALDDRFARHADAMRNAGVHYGILFAAVGGSGMVVEPCLYWPDASNPLIEETMDKSHRARVPELDANADSWALVQRIKQEIVDLMHDHGAAHFQIGRTYRYRDSLDPAADALLQAVKSHVDPRGLMNPGSLGLAG